VWAFSRETEKSGEGAPQGTHRANHNDSPKPERENRIVWKCMAELGISGGVTAGAERPMASTNSALAFGEKEFGSPARFRNFPHY
jgi:hypothetical protein